MTPSEKLSRAKPCWMCGSEIPPGTPLADLTWDARLRAWAHRDPPCERASAEVAGGLSDSGSPTGSPPDAGPRVDGPPRTEPAHRFKDRPAAGAWSITIELHEAEDPAKSKRVLRIARLHLGTLAEAREVAELLRKELGPVVPRELLR